MFESLKRIFSDQKPNREPSLEEAQATLIRSFRLVQNREASFGNTEVAELAKEIVTSELGLHPELVQMKAEISKDVRIGSPAIHDQAHKHSKDQTSEERTIDSELRGELEAELRKRTTINQLVHGGAHQIERRTYTSWARKINQDIGTGTADLYRVLMQSARRIYSLLPDSLDPRTIASPVGLSWVEVPVKKDEPVIVNAKAVCLPVLVQECAKGALEAVSLWGLPGATDGSHTPVEERERNKAIRKLVLQSDSVATDIRDVKAGDIVWKALVTDVVREGESVPRYLKALFTLPAEDFNQRIESALAGQNESLRSLLR